MNRKKNFRKKKVQKSKRRKSLSSSFIPQVKTPIIFSKTFRYTSDASTTIITRLDLINLLVVPYDFETAYPLIKTIRIDSIRMWAYDSTATNPLGISNSTSVEWYSALGKETVKTGTQMGTTPAFIFTVPPVNSLAGFWTNQDSTWTDTLVVIKTLDNTVIDIKFTIELTTVDATRDIPLISGSVGSICINKFTNFSPVNFRAFLMDYTLAYKMQKAKKTYTVDGESKLSDEKCDESDKEEKTQEVIKLIQDLKNKYL